MRLSKLLIIPAFFAAGLALNSCNAKVEVNVVRKTGIPMDGSQLIPAKPSAASGTLDVEYNKDTHLLSYKLVWTGLSGNATGIGLWGTAGRGYNVNPTAAAPVPAPIQNLTSGFPPAPAATYFGTVFIDGAALKEDALYLGEYYITIKTAAGAELRGQVEFP
jgi:hypothetical protein